jgi:hypothetical protein
MNFNAVLTASIDLSGNQPVYRTSPTYLEVEV